jgi:hypothetical protein
VTLAAAIRETGRGHSGLLAYCNLSALASRTDSLTSRIELPELRMPAGPLLTVASVIGEKIVLLAIL